MSVGERYFSQEDDANVVVPDMIEIERVLTLKAEALKADGVEFRVFKLFLSLASSLFETLFDLPQAPDPGTADQEMKDGLEVITTLAEDPSFENLTDVLSVLAAARKYSLDLIERKVCQALANPKVLETDSFRCFAIARNARLEHETVTAARHTLRQPLIPAWFADIELITASDLLALLTYHKNCSISVQTSVKNLKWIRDHYGSTDDSSFFLWNTSPVKWWTTYMQDTFELLIDRPSGDTVRAEAEKTIQTVRNVNCDTCSNRVKECMAEFSDLFARRVEEAADLIKLQMEFNKPVLRNFRTTSGRPRPQAVFKTSNSSNSEFGKSIRV
ncbi:hypothetical protein AZE42_02242 [Rhizopogon vesiculosus]|uniref:BTB domain-containing protein n=1 Tax=Rhizopogon vesiculosus TaxID=180088 RepID=A0A1J8Q2V5_9AGAM|nr:hypothetical protein AZE42_02242 [Rhizopogon vesiculosus]